ncbi:LysR substrate-binding domain-containing protein [Cupriavidus basilensis]|uniref:LysR substrate-binding domain-containing protein n=1 Tax=Cupriavidus basilensis TaxID=68895 RepID=A0ABT6B4V9_9BURK|nr:LysR substrate-binding domain-containing protein [Cupriavidus basilensis]MDF3839905.1 LysR substrate-binding domain-containing protein [Cupriavidus basilensis]
MRYFIAAAEEEHFGRASERLHVTRPAVSQIIADLESELSTPLFERQAHCVKLTAAGRALLPRLQAAMDDLHDAFAVAKRAGEGKSGALNIGYGSLTLLHPLFRTAIKQFHESFPDVVLSLFEIPTMEQAKALAEGKIHAGFMHFGPRPTLLQRKRDQGVLAQDRTVLDWIRIQTGGLGVVVPQDHPLAKRRRLSLAELAGERFVVVPRSSSSPGYGPIYALCKKAGFEPEIVQEVNTIASQLNLISVGMGIGLGAIGKNFSYPSSLVVIPLDAVSYTTSFVFGWVKGQRDPVLDRMIDIVKVLAENDS